MRLSAVAERAIDFLLYRKHERVRDLVEDRFNRSPVSVLRVATRDHDVGWSVGRVGALTGATHTRRRG